MTAAPHEDGAALVLDGAALGIAELERVARDPRVPVVVTAEARQRVAHGRRQIERIVEAYRRDAGRFEDGEARRAPVQDYGVTTGFGRFKDIPVPPEELERLQANLLLSHSVGIGDSADADDPASYYPAEVVRAVLAIRLNAFAKGHSGVRLEVLDAVAAMLERGIVPLVPLRGSVGSSGDLCPLAHLFAVWLGAGRYYVVRDAADMARRAREPESWRPAAALATDLGVEPPVPSFKEGLALINGTAFTTAMTALAVADAERLAATADLAAALALEAMCGCARAFDPKVHQARNLPGQIATAANVRAAVEGSRLIDSAGAVQDVYSLRCAPAVHGAARDALSHARWVVERELNAATDNPLFFPGEGDADHADEPWDFRFRANWPPGYEGDRRASYSAGNFHGEPIGFVADFLTLAVAELGSISERRTQLLLDAHHNRNLPANLIPLRGVNSGLMIAQYAAAAVVSENKLLTQPSSADSIPTSANSEDHVAMSTTAARKLRTVLANAQAVLGIELLTGAQAVEWRVGMERDPRADTPVAEGRDAWSAVQEEAERFRQVTGPGNREAIAAALGTGTAAVYRAVRQVVEPMTEDRPLDGDVRHLRALVADGTVVTAAEESLGQPLAVSAPSGRPDPSSGR